MKKLLLSVVVVTAALTVVAAASAHVGTDPREAPAGQSTTVGFGIGHGYEGSPTRSVSIRISAGVTWPSQPVPKPGWRSRSHGASSRSRSRTSPAGPSLWACSP